MALARIVITGVAAALSVLIALFAWALNGTQEDAGTPVHHTLDDAIGWSVAALFLIVLFVGAAISPQLRERWSWWGVGLTAAAALYCALRWTTGS